MGLRLGFPRLSFFRQSEAAASRKIAGYRQSHNGGASLHVNAGSTWQRRRIAPAPWLGTNEARRLEAVTLHPPRSTRPQQTSTSMTDSHAYWLSVSSRFDGNFFFVDTSQFIVASRLLTTRFIFLPAHHSRPSLLSSYTNTACTDSTLIKPDVRGSRSNRRRFNTASHYPSASPQQSRHEMTWIAAEPSRYKLPCRSPRSREPN